MTISAYLEPRLLTAAVRHLAGTRISYDLVPLPVLLIQQSTKFNATPPKLVSLYFDYMSASVWRMVATTPSNDTRCVPSPRRAAIPLTAPKAFRWRAAYPVTVFSESNSRQFLAENPRRPHGGGVSGLANDRARIEGENL